MSFKWTEGYPRDSNILDVNELNREYNNYKNVINGGMDRDNLPSSVIGVDHLNNQALLSHTVNDPDDIMIQGLGTLSTSPSYITYNDHLSGWKHNDAQLVTLTTKEGMLHLEFCCWFMLQQTTPDGSGDNRWAQMAVLINNTIVSTTHRLWQYAGNVNLSTVIPVASGVQEVKVAWRTEAPAESTSMTIASFAYGGGQLLLTNRYR